MATQSEFDGWSARSFKPDTARPEPVVWLRHLWVLKDFSPDAILRDFELRPGLNILWAQAFDGEVSLGQSGLSGHAAGKTTFCRLVRYILGERHLGTAEFREALCTKFPNAIVAGAVRLAGSDWMVCRSPGLANRDMAKRGADFDSLFDADNASLKLGIFRDAIDEAILPGLSSVKLPTCSGGAGWAYLLPWVARDQESRYARVLGWRSPDSESEAPKTPATDAAYLVRSVVGLVSSEEDQASDEHEELKQREHELSELLPKVEYRAQVDKDRIRDAVTRIDGLGGELFYDALIGRIDSELADLVGSRQKSPETAALEDAEDELDRIRRETMQADRDMADARRDLEHQQSHLAALRQKGQDEADADWVGTGHKGDDGKCGVPLAIALKTCHLAQQYNSLDFTSAQALASVEEQIPMWEEQVRSLEQDVKARAESLEQLKFNGRRAETQREAARQRVRDTESSTFERSERLSATRNLVVQLQQSEELRQQTEADLEQVRKKSRASAADLDKLRKAIKNQLSELTALFESILKAVLGKQVKASISPQADTIKLTVAYHGSRTSAATETIKLLAFDLACMLFSAEGQGGHPRLLIHDSPREADMSRDIYHRFFLYMRQLEDLYGEGASPNYQYIITTTEQPPEDMCVEPWLIRKLDASRPSGRLLGVDL